MARLLWLADALRAAGLSVYEVDGWRTRSAAEDTDASTFVPRGVIIHETRGSATSTDAGEIGVLVHGRVGLSGPIAQLYLSRTGAWHVVASGLCHHVRTGWGGPFMGLGNSRLLGIEPAHAQSEDWAAKPVQYASYVRGVAAILRHTGWPPPVGHKEHQPGDKPDPEFDMQRFRVDVARVLAGGSMIDDYGRYGRPAHGVADRTTAVMIADLWWQDLAGVSPYDGRTPSRRTWQLDRIEQTLNLIAAKVDIDPAELAAVTEAARAGAQAGVVNAADELAAAVVAALPDGELTRADVEQAVRSVLGSLDEG